LDYFIYNIDSKKSIRQEVRPPYWYKSVRSLSY
jgi:hypothetical protein